MNNKEAVLAVVGYNVNQNTLLKALLDCNLDADEDYEPVNSKTVDLAAVPCLQSLLSIGDYTEGDMTVKLDRKAIQAQINYLAVKHNIVELLPTPAPAPQKGTMRSWY